MLHVPNAPPHYLATKPCLLSLLSLVPKQSVLIITDCSATVATCPTELRKVICTLCGQPLCVELVSLLEDRLQVPALSQNPSGLCLSLVPSKASADLVSADLTASYFSSTLPPVGYSAAALSATCSWNSLRWVGPLWSSPTLLASFNTTNLLVLVRSVLRWYTFLVILTFTQRSWCSIQLLSSQQHTSITFYPSVP